MSSGDSLTVVEALEILEKHAAEADAQSSWPATSWDALRRCGALGWVIPREYGGAELDPLPLLEGYQRLAGACLTTCFLLSQRDSACRRLRDSGHEALCRELLPALASGQRFATVGLAQLTTSRQHVRPVLTARLDGDAVKLDGVMPWVTGAPQADHFLTGVILDDGRQMLLVVPRDAAGMSVGPPMELDGAARFAHRRGALPRRAAGAPLDSRRSRRARVSRRTRRRRIGNVGAGVGTGEIGY